MVINYYKSIYWLGQNPPQKQFFLVNVISRVFIMIQETYVNYDIILLNNYQKGVIIWEQRAEKLWAWILMNC